MADPRVMLALVEVLEQVLRSCESSGCDDRATTVRDLAGRLLTRAGESIGDQLGARRLEQLHEAFAG